VETVHTTTTTFSEQLSNRHCVHLPVIITQPSPPGKQAARIMGCDS